MLLLLLSFSTGFSSFLFSAEPIPHKEKLLDQYEKVLSLSEELNIYSQDTFHLLPKIRRIAKALTAERYPEAENLLGDVLTNLELLKSKAPEVMDKNLKLEWLETYLDLFQKYAFLALLAFGLMSWRPLKSRLRLSLCVMKSATKHSPLVRQRTDSSSGERGKGEGCVSNSKNHTPRLLLQPPLSRGELNENRNTNRTLIPFAAVCVVLGMVLSLFDISRYGESAWAFFDLQVVLTTIIVLLGGVLPGIFTAASFAVFRFYMQPHAGIYVAVILIAGLSAILFRILLKDFRRSGRVSFFAGFTAGLLQAGILYASAFSWMPFVTWSANILFIALLEGAGVWIFFRVISGILLDEDQKETENTLLKTRLLFLQAQMNPHFVFNSLNTISAICGHDATKAQQLILKLSDFLRRTLKREEEKVTLREEMDYVDAYLELEQARFAGRVQIKKEIQIQGKTWSTHIPILIVQPIVENAVKYGASSLESGGVVRIKITEESALLKIEISDNGPGLSASRAKEILEGKSNSKQGAGIGLKNIHERLQRLYGPSFGLQFETPGGGGTLVKICIPIKEETSS